MAAARPCPGRLAVLVQEVEVDDPQALVLQLGRAGEGGVAARPGPEGSLGFEFDFESPLFFTKATSDVDVAGQRVQRETTPEFCPKHAKLHRITRNSTFTPPHENRSEC